MRLPRQQPLTPRRRSPLQRRLEPQSRQFRERQWLSISRLLIACGNGLSQCKVSDAHAFFDPYGAAFLNSSFSRSTFQRVATSDIEDTFILGHNEAELVGARSHEAKSEGVTWLPPHPSTTVTMTELKPVTKKNRLTHYRANLASATPFVCYFFVYRFRLPSLVGHLLFVIPEGNLRALEPAHSPEAHLCLDTHPRTKAPTARSNPSPARSPGSRPP